MTQKSPSRKRYLLNKGRGDEPCTAKQQSICMGKSWEALPRLGIPMEQLLVVQLDNSEAVNPADESESEREHWHLLNMFYC